MSTEKRSLLRTSLITIFLIICSSAFAIVVHAIMPASVEVEQLDGPLVKMFGFPVIAVSYFLILYIQCTVAVRFISKRTIASCIQTGMRLGLAFALIYLVGMQEVVVEGSPFKTYGPDFIRYQFFMGLGDAIPAFLLCIMIAAFTINRDIKNCDAKSQAVGKLNKQESIWAVLIIAVCFFIERVIGYKTGIIQSDYITYPVPSYLWTALFGIALGCIYILLYSVLFVEGKRGSIPLRITLVIGVNWMIFNSFIGLIIDNAMLQMLLRSGLDVSILFICCFVIDRLILNNYYLHRQSHSL